MNAFYAGALLTLLLSVTMLRIDKSSISVNRASVHPIKLQQIFLSTWFKVEGQVVELWERPTSTFPVGREVCCRCHSHLDPTTDPGRSSQHNGAFSASRGRA